MPGTPLTETVGADSEKGEVSVRLGPVAQYGRGVGMVKGLADQLIGQFADALKAELAARTPAEPAAEETAAVAETVAAAPETSEAPAAPAGQPAAKPISGFSLVFKAIWSAIRGLFGGRSA